MTRMTWAYVAAYVGVAALLVRWLRNHAREEEPVRVCSFEVLHVIPGGDVIKHVAGGEECICGPTVDLVRAADGSLRWVAIHHALMIEACPDA